MVFNLCDEGHFNDPRKELHVPAILESMGVPYTGSGPQCLAFCYDKSLLRGLAREMGVPVPEAFLIKPQDSKFDVPLNFPVIVKPNCGDSSFGITARSVAYKPEDLINAVLEIRRDFRVRKTDSGGRVPHGQGSYCGTDRQSTHLVHSASYGRRRLFVSASFLAPHLRL